MAFDGFYLSYASASPPLLSPSVRHVMKHYSPEFYLRIVFAAACCIVDDRCVCHANVSWYPSAYDTVSTS